jgi:hypothetical protein
MAHGISEGFYQVLRDFLLYGTGQGSGASPAIWLSIVVCMLTALAALAPIAMSFADLWGDIFEERNADSFVDNMSNRCNDARLETAMPFANLIAHGQACAQIWERILYSGKVFLVFDLLAMGEWTTRDVSKYFLSWNYCTNLW